jgi:flagellar biosynthetic protein FlhB
MPDEGFQEKSERATPRKRQQARKKGQVARSRDLTSMAAMGGFILIFYFGGEYFFLKLSDLTGGILSLQYGMNPLDISKTAILQTGQILAPFFITSIVLVIAASVMQGGFVIKPLKFELNKLNPVSGIKRLFSLRGLTELLKSLLKFAIGGWVIYYIIKKDLKVLPMLSAMEMSELIKVSGKLVMNAIVIAFFLYLTVAFVSYLLERWQFERSLRMTKQEIKEEHKETEGDPLIKSRIRSIQREIARKRMMQEVPNATAVITNPQHLAVAIKYEDKKMHAPKIVAKGAGFIAGKIKEIAAKHGVPIIEDKPLARALFKLELNTYIPEKLYVAVAKILAYIFKLKGKI